ncbi:MAG: D-glycero-beta-D-manno-heptose-7-phosphate kinase [Deltaproteobacteria bacterium]|nr:D-glycero-beta-D-manno-heptose-7-phosphate kinase [Deltaproteobacteria bacterium]MCB9479528.1 D-glycero-beta-D-manno-heptose-7-phosphate kinase [Deltaproteobacteria bacterium]MCB9488442.1 D-glycero-beta-D-manno-heptose-7-phosphate kinase [Deltaproteobacteria bacterium]
MIKGNREQLLKLVDAFPGHKVMVVGDVMMDEFIWGSVSRISPEAPVPVVQVDKEERRLGGAANVARNLIDMSAEVVLAGVIGDDPTADLLREAARQGGVDDSCLLTEIGRPTTVKTRVIAHNQQVVRYDRESVDALPSELYGRLLERIEERATELEAVIVSDYGKGVIGPYLMDGLRSLATKYEFVIVVDPKIRNSATYHDTDLVTPNHHEAGELVGRKLPNEDAAVEKAGQEILESLRLKSLLITRAALGMTLFRPNQEPEHFPTVARQVFDVTGAGDSVIAATTLAKISGGDWREAASIANYAAGVVVGKIGTATATLDELREAMGRRPETA